MIFIGGLFNHFLLNSFTFGPSTVEGLVVGIIVYKVQAAVSSSNARGI